MRVILFSSRDGEQLAVWREAIRRVPAVSDVLTVGPAEAPFLAHGSRDGISSAHGLLSRVRAWRPDCGVAVAVPNLPPLVYSIPRLGTLGVRLGDGVADPPGLHELVAGATLAPVVVQWLGIDRRGIGASGRVPVYADDSPGLLAKRLEELGCLLLADALARVATGGAPGTSFVQPAPIFEPPGALRRAIQRHRLAWRRTRQRLTTFRIAKGAAVATWLAVARPVRDAMRTLLRRHPVRVFTFHRVTWLCRDGMSISPDTFRRQIEYILRSHDVVNLDKALSLVAGGARLRKPVAAVTFDDGYESVIRCAEPTMRKLGMAGACFVCPEVMSADSRYQHDHSNPVRDWLRVMNWDELRALHREGWHVGSHTLSHARVSELQGDDLVREMWMPRAALRERLTPGPVAFAYPFGGPGDVSAGAIDLARKCGYLAVLSDHGGENIPGRGDAFAICRIDIGGGHDDLMWRAMVHGLDLAAWRRRLR